MSARRPPSAPPTLPGFDFVRLLGSGGFADVFLYQQQLPRRQVAVKVLVSDNLGAASVTEFTAEANTMAQLATHPSIVSIYQAGVSEEGRPYLAMEYCSKPNLQVRHRRERFSEAEALRVGIQISGAVETAHRAGILHRDIKPANILVTDYGRPALTDFGIAAAAGAANEASGMSVPWSPPESFASPPHSDATTDVYALAATLYTLLAGRTPFEIPGGSNTPVDLIGRIGTMPVPAIGRPDVSERLELVLRTAMAKNAAERYPTAMAFARELQRIQIALGMQATMIDVAEEDLDLVEDPDENDGTRIRNIVAIHAQQPLPAPSPAQMDRQHTQPGTPAQPDAQEPHATVRRPAAHSAPSPLAAPEAPPVADTVLRPGAEKQSVAETATPQHRWRRPLLAAAIGIPLLALGTAAALALASGAGGGHSADPSAPVAAPVDVLPAGETVPQIPAVAGIVKDGKATFTWTDPDPKPGDGYLWQTVEQGSTGALTPVEQGTVTVPPSGVGRTCIQVMLRRSTGRTSGSATVGCTP